MQGIIIASHGEFCRGILKSAEMFFPDNLEQVAVCPLYMGDDTEVYMKQLKTAIETVDSGDGVIVLVDLMGGTPSNVFATILSERVQVITGMNFPMLLELLARRLMGEPIEAAFLMQAGCEGIKHLNREVEAAEDEDIM